MNRASKDFAWTRKSGGSPTGLSTIARKGRARTGFALPAAAALILLAVAVRATIPTRRPDSSLNSFQGSGHFSCQKRIAKLEKQMEHNYQVFLDLLNEKQRQINRLNKQTSAIKDAERLPDAWK